MRIDGNHNRIFLKDQTQKERKIKQNKHTKTSPPPSPLTKPSALRTHCLYQLLSHCVLEKEAHVSFYWERVLITFFPYFLPLLED